MPCDQAQGDLHILPIDDAIAHVPARTCWCQPTLDDDFGCLIVLHRSADGRETHEALREAIRDPDVPDYLRHVDRPATRH